MFQIFLTKEKYVEPSAICIQEREVLHGICLISHDMNFLFFIYTSSIYSFKLKLKRLKGTTP